MSIVLYFLILIWWKIMLYFLLKTKIRLFLGKICFWRN